MMRRIETIGFIVIFMLLNIPLLLGRFSEALIYIPQQVADGQLYRLATHPFVHISLYHLLLDGAAFILLYNQLNENSFIKRMVYLVGIHFAVTVGVTLALPNIAASSYCGISGIAHGLMGIWCLERITVKPSSSEQKTEGRIATIVFIGLIAKCIYETLAGHVFFESMHLGNVGIPVVASHLTGVLGAISVYYLLIFLKKGAGIMNHKFSHSMAVSASLLVLMLILPGCGGYYSRQTPGANMGIFRGGFNESPLEVQSRQPAAQLPITLAVARVQSSYSYQQKTNGYTVQNISVFNQPIIDRLSDLPGINQVEQINKLLTSGYHDSDVSLRRAASTLNAEMVYVYTLDTEYDESDWSSAVSLYTLGLAPTVTVEVTTTAMGVLLDTQTGYVYGVNQASSYKDQRAAFMTVQNAMDQCGRATQQEAFEKLEVQFKTLWNDVLQRHDSGQSYKTLTTVYI